MRCFLGIPLGRPAVDALERAVEAIRHADPEWRHEKWVPRENLHITVKFFGDLDEASLPELRSALAAACADQQPFALELRDVHAVPGGHKARMLWARFDDPGALAAGFATSVDEIGVEFGVEPEERSYKAHATLCRARRPHRIGLAALDAANIAIGQDLREFLSEPAAILYSSQLTADRPVYEVVDSWPLGDGSS